MAVDSSTPLLNSLLEKLRLDDPWIPPRSWDSPFSLGGASSQPPPHSSSSTALYATSTVSEPSLVRLSMNALQGVESALISIEKLSALLCYNSADRTSHRIPSLWNHSSSTVVIGNLLTSIGQFGCMIYLLRQFVDHFTNLDFGGVSDLEENPKADSRQDENPGRHGFTLINQAFAISVGKVIDGYMSALNTLSASVNLRRSSKIKGGGCLTSIGHSEMTLLEVYLHTEGLRTQMQVLGNLCNVKHLTVNFPVSSLEDLRVKSNSEYSAFPRSGALLSFLYTQLKVADPGHCALLKFLFIKSYEPYCDFIRSWIYDGSVSDPYNEFVVECVSDLSINVSDEIGICSDLPLPAIQVRDGVAVPCFLNECLIPLCRTGQQLQVIMRLLDMSTCFCHEKILPRLVGSESEYPGPFPLIFDKEAIEAMVHVRTSYYEQLLEKVDSILDELDFSSRQVSRQGVCLSSVNNLKNQNHQAYLVVEENMMPFVTDTKNQHTHDNIMDTEVPNIMHEHPCDEDLLESSDCSSAYESSEEQDEAENPIVSSYFPDAIYLSALDISLSLSTDSKMHSNQGEIACLAKDFPLGAQRISECTAHPFHNEAYHMSSEEKIPQIVETKASSWKYDPCQFDGYSIDTADHDLLHSPDSQLKLSLDYSWMNTEFDLSEYALENNSLNKDQHPLTTYASSKTPTLQKLKYDSKFLSMNPVLHRGSFFSRRSVLGESSHANHKSLDFDFTSVNVPLDTYVVKLTSVPNFGTVVPSSTEIPAAAVDTRNHFYVDYCNDNIVNKGKSSNLSSPIQKCEDEENLSLPNISGGSSWESLLGRSEKTVSRSFSDHKKKSKTGTDMPLDFVINKCVLDEILFQYTYLSKLTIKMLIEGFKLQEHLQSLRCYHFMDLADWADLFIMSLWNCKWHVNEVDKRIPEIQGILEQAVRRSSCEQDPNKNRLFVYLKGGDFRYLSPSAIGIHSFDYLGLGYQVDWPVTIILTPGALKIYTNIFNFLIQVKLAVFALSDVWCLLKGYKQPKGEAQQFALLTETRHKINHFVSTLQHYVLSQLSQVSWYRFMRSLKQKVKDMLDLESVHMAYLTESLHICFLSNETQSIAGIIQNILQCAMDFRSCLTGIILGTAVAHDEKNPNNISRSQVQAVRRAFSKNLEDLYLIYMQSPKHGEFGLSRFWDYLNYNEYYARFVHKRMGNSIFYS